MIDSDHYNTQYIKPKWEAAKLFYSEDDPGSEFEMSEWFDKQKKATPPGLILVKLDNGDVFKAFHFTGHRLNWCTWEEGYGFPGGKISHWAYIRKVGGKDRDNIVVWNKVSSEIMASS